ncbi:MAG: lipase [Gaiellales bacterium]|jgi:lipase|nr:lipase [Gaiellales bacterium]
MFHMLSWGSAELPAVVCLHDVRGHARRFERLARVLEPGRFVVAYDLRGHGRSLWSPPHTVDQHVEDLATVLASNGIDQTGLIGDGFGARIAIEFAVRHQERINSLTLLEPPLAPPQGMMRAAAESERRGGGFAGLDEAIEERRYTDGLHHTPRALLEEEMAEHLVADDDGRFRYRYSRDATATAYEEMAEPVANLGAVLCPTMLVKAAGRSWLTDADVELVTDQIRRVRIEEVPGGRVVLWDALAEASAVTRDFLVAKRTTA